MNDSHVILPPAGPTLGTLHCDVCDQDLPRAVSPSNQVHNMKADAAERSTAICLWKSLALSSRAIHSIEMFAIKTSRARSPPATKCIT